MRPGTPLLVATAVATDTLSEVVAAGATRAAVRIGVRQAATAPHALPRGHDAAGRLPRANAGGDFMPRLVVPREDFRFQLEQRRGDHLGPRSAVASSMAARVTATQRPRATLKRASSSGLLRLDTHSSLTTTSALCTSAVNHPAGCPARAW